LLLVSFRRARKPADPARFHGAAPPFDAARPENLPHLPPDGARGAGTKKKHGGGRADRQGRGSFLCGENFVIFCAAAEKNQISVFSLCHAVFRQFPPEEKKRSPFML